jgi:hypothetical protein
VETKQIGEIMPENTQQEYLDKALEQLDANLLLWGIDNWLGYRTAETMKLSVAGATNLVALVNTLNSEIGRLSAVIGELYSELQSKGN